MLGAPLLLHQRPALNMGLFYQKEFCVPQSGQCNRDGSEEMFSEDKEVGLEALLDDLSLDSETRPKDQQLKKDNTAATLGASPIGSLQPSEILNKHRSTLSPVNTNVDRAFYDLLEPQTPRLLTETNSQILENMRTPLDKFDNCNTTFKNHLTKQYLELLNAACREELLELKGIGPKRADYILELRLSGPICSLDDLEKIGLSSKQVHNLLNGSSEMR